MKKTAVFILIMMAFSTAAFAMAKKPDPNTFNGCIQRPYTECSKYGNPWTGNLTPEWTSCANAIYDQCRCSYRPDLVKYNTGPCK